MIIKFDNKAFKAWFELNNMTRNRVIKELGQRDPNKVGRWLLGQTIGTEDLLGLCNHFNLELSDFLIIKEDVTETRINTLITEEMKERRGGLKPALPAQPVEAATSSLAADDITIARLSLKYEQEINALVQKHNKDIREQMSSTRHQLESRNKVVSSLQDTIDVLNKTIQQMQANMQGLQDTIHAQQATIESQQATIATMDALIRKQKKIPSQTNPKYLDTFGSSMTVCDGGNGAHASLPPAETL